MSDETQVQLTVKRLRSEGFAPVPFQDNGPPIPQGTLESLNSYVQDGIPPGGFLEAALVDSLVGAYQAADDANLAALTTLAHYLFSVLPDECWGSPTKVQAWLEEHRNERQEGR